MKAVLRTHTRETHWHTLCVLPVCRCQLHCWSECRWEWWILQEEIVTLYTRAEYVSCHSQMGPELERGSEEKEGEERGIEEVEFLNTHPHSVDTTHTSVSCSYIVYRTFWHAGSSMLLIAFCWDWLSLVVFSSCRHLEMEGGIGIRGSCIPLTLDGDGGMGIYHTPSYQHGVWVEAHRATGNTDAMSSWSTA